MRREDFVKFAKYLNQNEHITVQNVGDAFSIWIITVYGQTAVLVCTIENLLI